MARKSEFVFSGERPSPATTEIPIAINNQRQPPVSHQPPRPQQLPDLSPAAARNAPTFEIPVTFSSGPPPRPITHVPSVDSNWVLAVISGQPPPQPSRGPQQSSPAAASRAPVTFNSGLSTHVTSVDRDYVLAVISGQAPPQPSRGPQQSSPAAASRAPLTFTSGLSTHVTSVDRDYVLAVISGQALPQPSRGPQQSSPAAASRAPLTFTSGLPPRPPPRQPRTRHDNINWVPAAGPAYEEGSPVEDVVYGSAQRIITNHWWGRNPDVVGMSQGQHSGIPPVVHGSAQRIITNHWWGRSQQQHSGLLPRPRPLIIHDNNIWAPGPQDKNIWTLAHEVDDQISKLPDPIQDAAACEVAIREIITQQVVERVLWEKEKKKIRGN